MSEERKVKQVMEMRVEGMGRPRINWEDTVERNEKSGMGLTLKRRWTE